MRIRRHLPIAVLACILGVALGFGQTINQEPLPDDPDRLVQLLGDGDLQRTFMLHKVPNSTAVRAASALIKMKDDAVPALERALPSSNERHRLNIVYVLARIPTVQSLPGQPAPASDPHAVVRVLIRAASDSHAPVRAIAIASLPAYTSKEPRQTVLAALNDVDPQVRNAAILALAPRGEITAYARHVSAEAIIPLLDNSATQYWAVHTLGQLRSNVAAIPLLKSLTADDNQVRSAAAQALGLIKDKRVVVELCAGLKDADPNVRMHMCNALGEIGDTRATPALLHTLSDKEAFVRRGAAVALGKLADVRASDKLILLLEDSDEQVRSAAAEAVGLIGEKRAVDALGKLLLRNSEKSSRAAATAFGRIRDPGAIEPLKQCLLVPDLPVEVAQAAAQALGQIRHPDSLAALVKASETAGYVGAAARNVLSDVTGTSFQYQPQTVIDAWWQSNRDRYYRQVPEEK